ncbi:alpha/beta hydrolase family protein [Archangium lansingense]|uniref:alpha/beta hydrolase family protein n=1 Tax=Archangium lansingense TaxID=2995310 RepID=UPI003B7FAE32
MASPLTPTEAEQLSSVRAPFAVTREHVTDDIYHYQFDIRVGSTPNARVRIHRVVRELAPWRPRPTQRAVMLLHGDFANFVTNFMPSLGNPASSAPGLAPYLVSRGIDTWGVDRRWTLPTADGDISDMGEMGVNQALGDTAVALAFARSTRTVTDRDPGRIVLGGFSHGAQLTYAYAAADGRHVSAIAALDIYYDLAPEDADLRAFACANAEAERDALAQGVTDSSNSFFITAGLLARSAPLEPSPLFPSYTNRGVLLTLAGQTWLLAPYTHTYHLSAPLLDADGNVSAMRESSEDRVSAWFASAPPHQALREAADFDDIWCGTSPRPELSNIRVPLFYLGAAGGFGDHGLYSTTRVSSTDVTTLVIRRFGPDRVAEDFGHGDLLYAEDAPTLAWRPFAAWLLRH